MLFSFFNLKEERLSMREWEREREEEGGRDDAALGCWLEICRLKFQEQSERSCQSYENKSPREWESLRDEEG